jgi:hypothetical protein
MVEVAEHSSYRAVEFAEEVANGVAGLTPYDVSEDSLTLTFGLSAWMRRCSVGRDEACAGLSMLRDALLAVSGLDRRTEPVPLRTADAKTTLVIMTTYVEGLVSRAAASAGVSREAVVDQAVAYLHN